MSIISVEELFIKRTGGIDESGKKDKKIYQVFTDDTEDGPLVVIIHDDIPVWHSIHPDDATLWVRSVIPSPIADDGLSWEVAVSYNLIPDGTEADEGEEGINPWDLDPVISFSFQPVTRVLERAYETINETDVIVDFTFQTRGTRLARVTNSAEQPFDPPAIFEEYRLMISIQRNIEDSDFDQANVQKFQNTINNENITVANIDFLRLELLCRDYKATKTWTAEQIPYWQETIEVIHNEETWVVQLVDQGLFTADPPSGSDPLKLKPILDSASPQRPVTEPVLLDGSGQRLGNDTGPIYIFCHARWEEDWGGFLPTDA